MILKDGHEVLVRLFGFEAITVKPYLEVNLCWKFICQNIRFFENAFQDYGILLVSKTSFSDL